MKLFEQKPVGMTASQWDKAKRIGSGRYSEGVRVAVEAYREVMRQGWREPVVEVPTPEIPMEAPAEVEQLRKANEYRAKVGMRLLEDVEDLRREVALRERRGAVTEGMREVSSGTAVRLVRVKGGRAEEE